MVVCTQWSTKAPNNKKEWCNTMKLKKKVKRPVKRSVEVFEQTPVQQKTQARKKGPNTLPSDEYPKVYNKRILVRQEDTFRQYLDISVKRFNEDDDIVNPYFVQVTMYQESEKYTGYLKGKTVYFPLDNLYEVLDELSECEDECQHLVDEE